jgi:hypothetical protein
MACVHLQQLYKLCQEHDVKLSGSDLIHIVCHECGEQEVCPSALRDEHDARESSTVREAAADSEKPEP